MPTFRVPEDNKPPITVVKLPRPIQDLIDNPVAKGGRNNALKFAALQVRDMGKSEDECFDWMSPYICTRDGLPEVEALRTIRSMYSRPARKPAGHIPHGTIPTHRVTHTPRPEPLPPTKYEIEEDFKLPDPIESPVIALLEALYRPGEHVFFQAAKFDEDKDKEKPDSHDFFPSGRDELLKILREKTGGSLAPISGFDLSKGLYFNLNPVSETSTSRKKEDITEIRYGLIEFDHIPKEEQFQVLVKSRLPLAAILDSGRNSIHGIIKIGAGRDEEKFKARMNTILDHLAAHDPCAGNVDITRLSRFPSATRLDSKKEQKLLMLETGCKTYEEWERELVVEKDGLPAIQDMAKLLADLDAGKLVEPVEVIQGVAHEGCKLVLAASSKAKKTWTLADLCASVCSGGLWMDYLRCNKGRVLYLNMELPEYFMVKRVQMILTAKGMMLEPGMFHVINLRGFSASLEQLRPKLEHAIEDMKFTMIVLDPTYKLMPGGDENGTQDSSLLLNEIERLAVKSGALCAFASHFSKGNQALKNAIDRPSGSGVFARDPDTIITMTEHKETGALSVDLILRNHAPVTSFVVKWEFPLFKIDPELDPTLLAADPRTAKKEKEPTGLRVTPGQHTKIKDFLAANPKASKEKFAAELMTIFKLGCIETAKRSTIPSLKSMGIIEEFDSEEKRGLKPTKNYLYIGDKKPEVGEVGKVE